MSETIIKTFCVVIAIVGLIFASACVGQLNALEDRVEVLEEAGTSWDITIVRPATE